MPASSKPPAPPPPAAAAGAAPVAAPPSNAVSRRAWIALLVAGDAVAALAAAAISVVLRFGGEPSSTLDGLSYWILPPLVVPLWCLVLAGIGAYDPRYINSGVEELRRVGNAVVWMLAVLALASYVLRADVSRGVVGMTLVLLTLFTVAGHRGVRRLLRRRLHDGRRYLHRIVAVGLAADCRRLAEHLQETPTGFDIAAIIEPEQPAEQDVHQYVLSERGIVAEARRSGADTVAVCSIEALAPGEIRRLSWALEGTGLRLLAVPALTDVAGPRIVPWPLGGLPLLEIEVPEFSGIRRLTKGVLDRVLATTLLLGTAPLLLVAAIAIKLGDRGPVLYRQTRIGLAGTDFSIWKLRTMRVGADREHGEMLAGAEHDGVLFKLPRDPRVTAVGRILRRFSIDELPQLINVVNGSMSLVGPRPQRPHEVVTYGEDARRRLLVKPGITGLWQVSGRSDLSWAEALRLDLYYVENWSVALDLLILARTFGAVLRSRGAY
jgi:exopolysaccharide biosynthesis polyprenyl glycosylphosphotransferase